jgi:hypothetical protein
MVAIKKPPARPTGMRFGDGTLSTSNAVGNDSTAPEEQSSRRDVDAANWFLYQGTTLEAAEKLAFLKGTAFRPYITGVR